MINGRPIFAGATNAHDARRRAVRRRKLLAKGKAPIGVHGCSIVLYNTRALPHATAVAAYHANGEYVFFTRREALAGDLDITTPLAELAYMWLMVDVFDDRWYRRCSKFAQCVAEKNAVNTVVLQ